MIQGGLLQKEMHGAHTTLSLMIDERGKYNRRHCFRWRLYLGISFDRSNLIFNTSKLVES